MRLCCASHTGSFRDWFAASRLVLQLAMLQALELQGIKVPVLNFTAESPSKRGRVHPLAPAAPEIALATPCLPETPLPSDATPVLPPPYDVALSHSLNPSQFRAEDITTSRSSQHGGAAKDVDDTPRKTALVRPDIAILDPRLNSSTTIRTPMHSSGSVMMFSPGHDRHLDATWPVIDAPYAQLVMPPPSRMSSKTVV